MLESTNLRDAAAVVALFERAARALRESPHRDHSVVRLPARGQLLVTGDLHDNPTHLAKVLHIAHMRTSRRRHLILQEMIHGEQLINGMDFSHRMLARVAELVLEFEGRVHPLLANHELSQMTGRAVSKGSGNRVEMFNAALDFVYGDAAEEVSGAIAHFIGSMPVALLTESGVMCSHSLPDAHMMHRFDWNLLQRDVAPPDLMAPSGSVYLLVWGRQYTAESVEGLAGYWNVRLFCVGHQHVEMGAELRMRRVIVLNTDHERAAVLPLDLARVPSPEEAVALARPLAAVAV
jgi:hypothetical protein